MKIESTANESQESSLLLLRASIKNYRYYKEMWLSQSLFWKKLLVQSHTNVIHHVCK